jgi:hypothetical protein
MNCKNCGEVLTGKYCSNCGQKASVDKLNLSSFSSEISDGVFNMNKGLFYTIKELFTRPGHTIREFLEGKRKNHFKPLTFVLTLSTIYLLITRLSDNNTWLNEIITGYFESRDRFSGIEELPPMMKWMSSNFAYSNLLLLPLFSFASYLCFRKYDKNYLEHIVLNSFVTGLQVFFYSTTLIMELVGINFQFIQILAFPVSILYAFWVYWQFFTAGKKRVIIFRILLTYILYLFLFSIVLEIM